MRFAYWLPVDRHGLSDLAMTRLERNGSEHTIVIARRTRGRRGNPLHAIDAFRQFSSFTGPSRSPRADALAMTRCVGMVVCGSVISRSLSLRGENASERRGNPSCPGGGGRVCLFAYWLTVDRHGLRPRDDNMG